MKILHTSDWHLGQSLYNFNREDEFRDFFVQLRNIIKQEKPDAMLVSGDIFDTPAPSNSVVALYNKELLSIQQENEGMQTIVTAGNHDSPSRLSSAGVLWKEFGVTVIGTPPRKDGEIDLKQMIVPIKKNGETLAWVLAVPYMHSSSYPAVEEGGYGERVKSLYHSLYELADKERKDSQPIIAMGHLTLSQCDVTGHNITIGSIDTVSTDIWAKGFSYVALGHIHHRQYINNEKIRYCGSPLPMSFDEKGGHSVNIVEFEGREMVSVREIDITPLVDVRTVPAEAASFDEVKQALLDYPNDKSTYLRANILTEGVMPVDMFGELSACLEEKDQLKLCTLCQTQKKREIDNSEQPTILSLDELKQIQPLDVAKKTYKVRKEEEMPQSLVDCMTEAIGACSTEGKEDAR